MKQLGNLVLVCAQRRSVELRVESGEVRVSLLAFPGAPAYHLRWDDDKKIEEIIHELNFGRYSPQNADRYRKGG